MGGDSDTKGKPEDSVARSAEKDKSTKADFSEARGSLAPNPPDEGGNEEKTKKITPAMETKTKSNANDDALARNIEGSTSEQAPPTPANNQTAEHGFPQPSNFLAPGTPSQLPPPMIDPQTGKRDLSWIPNEQNRKRMKTTKWGTMFHRLLQFKARNGHVLVPNRCEEDPSLGSWVSTQRRQHKLLTLGQKSSMTRERVEKLEAIGFAWATSDPRHVPWEQRYKELIKYSMEHGGSTLVPIGYKENPQLANWVSTQRQEMRLLKIGRSSRLTKERIEALEAIGFVWEAYRGGRRPEYDPNVPSASGTKGHTAGPLATYAHISSDPNTAEIAASRAQAVTPLPSTTGDKASTENLSQLQAAAQQKMLNNPLLAENNALRMSQLGQAGFNAAQASIAPKPGQAPPMYPPNHPMGMTGGAPGMYMQGYPYPHAPYGPYPPYFYNPYPSAAPMPGVSSTPPQPFSAGDEAGKTPAAEKATDEKGKTSTADKPPLPAANDDIFADAEEEDELNFAALKSSTTKSVTTSTNSAGV
mmetsp:Transcript_15771/g.23232  ORF Transcript_15771/g.23232 Transcript_15771/m.23232 type:complete len:529 (-) Transcript_15771:1082-2668(-)